MLPAAAAFGIGVRRDDRAFALFSSRVVFESPVLAEESEPDFVRIP
jgi:hypothetical protein